MAHTPGLAMTMEFEVVSLAPWAVFALIAVLLLTNVWLGTRK